jgi:hypothetical protein
LLGNISGEAADHGIETGRVWRLLRVCKAEKALRALCSGIAVVLGVVGVGYGQGVLNRQYPIKPFGFVRDVSF